MEKLDFAKQGLMVNLFADKIALLADKASGLADKIGVLERVHPVLLKIASGAMVAVTGFAALETSAQLAGMALTFMTSGPIVTKIMSIGPIARGAALAVSMMAAAFNVVTAAVRASTLAMLSNPVLLTVAAVAAAGAAIYYNWDKIGPMFKSTWDWMERMWDRGKQLATTLASETWERFKSIAHNIGDAVQRAAQSFESMFASGSAVVNLGDTMIGKFAQMMGGADMLKVSVGLLKIAFETFTAPLKIAAAVLETIMSIIDRASIAFQKGGLIAGIESFFNRTQAALDLVANLKTATAGVLQRLSDAVHEAAGGSGTAETAGARGTAAPLARPQAETMKPAPVEVKMNGPVMAQLDAKGRLGVDVRIAAEQGLRVSGSGVDRSGAPSIVGDVGVMVVTPR
jgi:hypothetical protein